MWHFEFIESTGVNEHKSYEKGAWFVHLTLMEHSPPTHIDSRLLISDARFTSSPAPSSPAPSSPALLSPASLSPTDTLPSLPGRLLFTTQSKDPNRLKPTIELRIRTNGSNQLAPLPKARERCDHTFVHSLSVPLSKSLMGNSLQFE